MKVGNLVNAAFIDWPSEPMTLRVGRRGCKDTLLYFLIKLLEEECVVFCRQLIVVLMALQPLTLAKKDK